MGLGQIVFWMDPDQALGMKQGHNGMRSVELKVGFRVYSRVYWLGLRQGFAGGAWTIVFCMDPDQALGMKTRHSGVRSLVELEVGFKLGPGN